MQLKLLYSTGTNNIASRDYGQKNGARAACKFDV